MLFYPLLVLGFLLLFTQIKSAANLYDEGLVLTNAERIRAGEVPYRDFWTMYGPGYFYALAGLFSLVEPTILVARLFDTVLRSLLTLEVYLLARSVTSHRAALIPYAFVTFWLATIRFYSYPAFPATGGLLLAALVLTGYLRGGRSRWLFLSGMALGLTALLRLDFGGYGAFGFGMALALFELRKPSAAGGVRPNWPARVPKAEASMGAGALPVALPMYACLVLASGFATVVDGNRIDSERKVQPQPVVPLPTGELTEIGDWRRYRQMPDSPEHGRREHNEAIDNSRETRGKHQTGIHRKRDKQRTRTHRRFGLRHACRPGWPGTAGSAWLPQLK